MSNYFLPSEIKEFFNLMNIISKYIHNLDHHHLSLPQYQRHLAFSKTKHILNILVHLHV